MLKSIVLSSAFFIDSSNTSKTCKSSGQLFSSEIFIIGTDYEVECSGRGTECQILLCFTVLTAIFLMILPALCSSATCTHHDDITLNLSFNQ